MKTTPRLEKEKCFGFLVSFFKNINNETCPPSFDESMCWPSTNLSYQVSLECPFEFCNDCGLSDEDRRVTRRCLPNGTWAMADYKNCREIFYNVTNCIETKCHRCPGTFHELISIVTLVLSVVSTILLLFSLFLFGFFKSIQCRRLTIHKHLAAAFVIRFLSVTVWSLTQMFPVFLGCAGLNIDWLCKMILFLSMYSTMASTFWMFVEGAYLVSRFTIFAMRSSEGHIALYLLAGWVLPFLLVLYWATALELQPDLRQRCWLPYTKNEFIWLLVGPTAIALGFNVLFMLIVIIILVGKLKDSNHTESDKIWKTIKATLFLVPLLGVSNLLLFFEPSESDISAQQAYMLFSSILQHSQGIFVAILYCFLNTEVQDACRRSFKKWRLYYKYGEKKPLRTYLSVSQSDNDLESLRVLQTQGSDFTDGQTFRNGFFWRNRPLDTIVEPDEYSTSFSTRAIYVD